MSESTKNEHFSLIFEQLVGVRGYSILFSGLDFSLPYGRFAALKGPNGSGKTTLLRMIAGLIAPESGKVRTCIEVYHQGPFYLGHEHGLRSNETPLSHLRDWADLHRAPRSSIPDALERLGLTARQNVSAHALSAGQKKRVGLARALIAHRKLWLLDEPAASLDVAGQSLLCALIKEHIAGGGACLAALHDPLELVPDDVLDLGALTV